MPPQLGGRRPTENEGFGGADAPPSSLLPVPVLVGCFRRPGGEGGTPFRPAFAGLFVVVFSGTLSDEKVRKRHTI